MAEYVIHATDGTVDLRLNAKELREVMLHLPSQTVLRIVCHHALDELRMQMTKVNICPGSGQHGEPRGALLWCHVCDRLIGIHPPDILVEHNRPEFDDGRQII